MPALVKDPRRSCPRQHMLLEQERGQPEPPALAPITVFNSFFYTKLTERANGGYYYHNGGVQR
jgi:Ulp1 family protease